MLKKTLSVVLALSMLCTMLPAFTLTASAAVTEIVYPMDYIRLAVNGTTEKDVGVIYPDTLSRTMYNSSSWTSTQPASDWEPNPENHVTYFLLAYDGATSNMKFSVPGGTENARNENPWIGYNLLRGNGAYGYWNGTIVIPESAIDDPNTAEVETEREFQFASYVARTPSNGAWNRYAIGGTNGTSGRGIFISVDGKYVSVSQEEGKIDAFTNLINVHEEGKLDIYPLIQAGYVDYNNTTSTYWQWEWSAPISLTAGVHEIECKLAGGAFFPGLVISSKLGHDWTKAVPMYDRNVSFNNGTGNIKNREFVANSFGAKGYIDTTAPSTVSNVNRTDYSFSEVTLAWDAATDPKNTNNLNPYSVGYEVTLSLDDEVVKTVSTVDTSITIDELSPSATYDYSIVAIDGVGNKSTAVTGTVATKDASESDEAYFATEAELTAYETTTSSVSLTWDSALLGDAATGTADDISYNVYVNGVFCENIDGNNITIEGLNAEVEYNFAVIPMLGDAESTMSKLVLDASTADLPYNDTGVPPVLCYETVENWTGGGAAGNGFLYAITWMGASNEYREVEVDIAEAGNYYVIANAYAYGETLDRHILVDVTQNGTTYNAYKGGQDADDVKLCINTGNDYKAETSKAIALNAGKATIKVTAKGGAVRVDYVALVKADSFDAADAVNQSFKDEFNTSNHIPSDVDRAQFQEYFGLGLVSAAQVTFEKDGTNAIINWTPNTLAKGNKAIEYAVSINGVKTKTYDYQARTHTYEMSDDDEFGGLLLGDNTLTLTVYNDGEEVFKKSGTVTLDASELETPYFSGTALATTLTADADEDALTSTLPLTWGAAVVNDGEFTGSYNVYVNDELKANVSAPEYVAEGLEPATEYNVKVVVVDGETELDEYVTTLTASFTTAVEPSIALVEAGENSATVNVTDLYGVGEYEIALYGAAANWSLNDDGSVTIIDLLPGTRYEITVKAIVDFPYSEEKITYVHKKFAFTTDGSASGEATYTSGMPIINGALAEAQGILGVDGGQNNNDGKWNYVSSDGYKGVFGQAGVPVFYAGSGHAVTFTVESPAEAQYYVGVETGCYDANARYVTVTVNGQTIDYRYTGQNMTKSVAPTPVTLNEGENTIVIKANGGWCRIDHAVFISANSQAKAMAEYSAANDATAMEGAFGIPTTMISEGNVILTQLGADSVMASWTPNEVARDKTLTFSLTLNDEPPVVLNNNARRYTFNSFDGLVLGTNTLKMTVTDEMGNEEVVNKTIEISTLLETGVSEVMVQEEVDGVMQDSDYTDSVTISVSNPTGEVKPVKVMAVVYSGNRVIEKHVKDIDLLLSESVTFDLANDARSIKATAKLSPALVQVKYFVLDMTDDGYLPLELNY